MGLSPSSGGSGLAMLVPFDEAGYLAQPRKELAHEYYEDQVSTYLAANQPGISIADVPYDGPILTQEIDAIPSSLPYTIVGSTDTFGTIPATMTHRVEITLTRGWTELFNVPLTVPDVSLDRLTISFTSDGMGGLTPQLRQGGQVVASGPSVTSGSDVQLTLTHFDPGDNSADRSFTYDQTAGQYLAVGLDARQVSEETIIDMRQVVNDAAIARANSEPYAQDDQIGGLLHLAVMKWFHDTDRAEDIIDSLTHAAGVYNSVASGITTAETTLDYYPEQQIPYHPDGMIIDVANNYSMSFPIDNDTSGDAMRDLITGHNSSALEYAVWEELVSVESISTIKSLQLANERGIPIFVIDIGNAGTYLPQLTHRASIRNEIQVEVYSGATVTVPRDETPLNDWSGVGYITRRVSSEGYIINGGLNSATPRAYQGGSETGTDPNEPSDPNTNKDQDTTNDPVNIANGNVTHDETDIRLPGIGLPLEFARHYDSQSDSDVGLGAG